jgi:TolB-like protein
VAGALALAAVAGGCAAGGTAGEVTPADIPALEAQRAQTPNDPALNLRLARAYHAGQRHADARAALAVVLAAQPEDPQARAYLGLTYEALEHYDSARTVYTTLLETRPARDVERLLRGRLQLLARKELQQAARLAIARESQLAGTPPEPNTVAVMPFRYTGSDSTLRPLERGLAALVITDLSKVQRLRIVERERLQALIDEMQLAEGGRVDPATGARSGRLLRAGQVVQGQFMEVPTANFRVDASVVRAADGQVAATGSDSDLLRALFDIEKRIVFQLIERLGITLTPAERTAIGESPTRDLQAFLLYSRGLEAQDRGDFRAAAAAFRAAAQQDPGFAAAAEQAAAAEATEVAATAPPAAVATAIGSTGTAPAASTTPIATLATAINAAVPSGVITLETVATTSTISVPPTNPNPVCEVAGCQGLPNATLTGTIIIIVRRP